jgi:hypothetical protein
MVPALICCATVLNAVAFREAITLCPAIVAQQVHAKGSSFSLSFQSSSLFPIKDCGFISAEWAQQWRLD